MKEFTFYDLYYDAISQLSDNEAGFFIKRICNYAVYETEDVPSKDEQSNVLWELIYPTLESATEIERAGKTPYYLNRKMRHFTFHESYANMIRTMVNNKNAGMYVKAMCEYMFNGVTPTELLPELQGAFNIFKKTFDISKARSESGKKGGQKKKPPMTLARIREDFPEITGNLHENNPILDGVNLGELYKFIKENEDIRSLNMYGVVEKFREKTR